jgi:thioesterase domain-containing protein
LHHLDRAQKRRVEEAARDYLGEVRTRQPNGPYLLSGYSGGGITAYEMAQQLKAAGEEVAVLALLDTPLPVRPALTKPDKAMIKMAEIRSKGPAYLVEWVRARYAWEIEKRQGPGSAAAGNEFNNVKIQNAFLEAVGTYQTAPWSGPLTLFRPPLDQHWKVTGGHWVSSEKEYVFEDNEWRKYVPHMQVVEVPGDHESMVLAPNVTTLAQELREVIAAALHRDADWPEATAAE